VNPPVARRARNNWLARAVRVSLYRLMNLVDARAAVSAALSRMHAVYGETVFNEWVLVSLRADRNAILAYDGPRPEKYKQHFTLDLASMLKELAGQKLGVGDFAFAADATGTHYDACMRLGESSYLFCNHTTRTMAQIRLSPLWLSAQKHWVELSQKFATDPLE
jgi:hypothetical protein